MLQFFFFRSLFLYLNIFFFFPKRGMFASTAFNVSFPLWFLDLCFACKTFLFKNVKMNSQEDIYKDVDGRLTI